MRVMAMVLIVVVLGTFEALDAQEPVANLPSCYALEVGEWQPRLQQGNEPYQSPPAEVVLHDSVGTSRFERGKMIVRPVIPKGRTPSAFWEPIGSDSLRVVWTNGFAGVTMRLGSTHGVLRGRASAFTDVRGEGQENPTATVMAIPIRCAGLVESQSD